MSEEENEAFTGEEQDDEDLDLVDEDSQPLAPDTSPEATEEGKLTELKDAEAVPADDIQFEGQ